MANFIIYTNLYHLLPIAPLLEEKGHKVIYAVMTDKEAEGEEDTSPIAKLKRERQQHLGDGIIKKYPAKKVTELLLEKEVREDVYILFDFNHGYQYGEALKKKGYKGFFAERWAFELEREREKSVAFVKKYYPQVRIPESIPIKGKDIPKFLQKNRDRIWCVKPNSEDVSTFVPFSEEPALAIEEIMAFYEDNQEALSKIDVVMQEKIIGTEVNVETVYYEGKPVACVVDLENKYLQEGERGEQTGCSFDLVFYIPLEAPIRKMLNEPFDAIAKKMKLTGIMDMNVIFSHATGEPYFLEFCPNRWGFNAIFTEWAIWGDENVDEYLTQWLDGKLFINPEKEEVFGASIRLFNLNYDKMLLKYVLERESFQFPSYIVREWEGVWLWDVFMDGGELKMCLADFNSAIVTAVSDTAEGALAKAKKKANRKIDFPGKYFRDDVDEFDRPYNPAWRYYFLKDKKLLEVV